MKKPKRPCFVCRAKSVLGVLVERFFVKDGEEMSERYLCALHGLQALEAGYEITRST